MQSIYLYDSALRLIKAIEKAGNIKIHTLTTQGHYFNDREKIKKENPFLNETNFLLNTLDEYFPEEPISLEYDIIEKFRPTHYRVRKYMARTGLPLYEIQYLYYRALSYFYKRFEKGEINGVMTVLPLHGSPLEMIPIDIAIQLNLPVYTLDILYANPDGYYLWGLWDYLKNDYVNLGPEKKPVDLKNYLFYNTKREYKPQGKALYKSSLSELSTIKKMRLVIQTLYTKSSESVSKKAIINSFMGQYPVLGFYYLYFSDKLFKFNYNKHKRTKKVYDKFAIKPDFSKKILYYPLHLDPEASTLVRETLSNQLTIIKMLNDSLPDGWEICIKEHPVIFSFLKKKNLRQNWYFFLTMSKYRGAKFYQLLNQLDKVKVISLKYSSEEILKKSQAVATINGTICLEAMHIHKPILLFGEKLVAKYVKGIFNIRSSEDCKKALRDINYGYVPQYDLEIMQPYLFEMYLNVIILKSELFDMNSEIVKTLSSFIKKIF